MSTVEQKTHGPYFLGSSFQLSKRQIEHLIRLFNRPMDKPDSVLGGRSTVTVDLLAGIGSIVVKHYTRGGLLRHLVKKRYIKWGKPRCQIEHELLNKVRHFGVNAPEPIAHAYRGHLFYKGWLVTREIEQNQTLAKYSVLDEAYINDIMGKLTHQVAILIENKILHVDLHPGNVLVDKDGRVFLIDFDKGCLYLKDKSDLRDRYLARWKRAVIKHKLPEILIEKMNSGLLEKV